MIKKRSDIGPIQRETSDLDLLATAEDTTSYDTMLGGSASSTSSSHSQRQLPATRQYTPSLLSSYHNETTLPTMRKLMFGVASSSGSCSTQHYHRKALRRALRSPLDRVNVLGEEDGSYGHTGCVNALNWAKDGEILISGGDDTTVRLWRLDPNETSKPYPYRCDSVIHTGHTGNIFDAHLLPLSSKIATVAGDYRVRVFDVERALTTSNQGRETDFSTSQTLDCELRCHSNRTKRIVTEASPDSFLTVSEDGTVRQHDLRAPHRCRRGHCPNPLVKLPFDLSSLALSPLAPYQFVVAGESQFGYLFDRRQVGRALEAEWGKPPDSKDYVTCVRRFGRQSRGPGEAAGSEHVTGARMAQTNSYEVLLSYSGDAVYLYSTRDDPEIAYRPSSVLAPNAKKRKASRSPEAREDSRATGGRRRSRSGSRSTGESEESEENEDLMEILEIMRRRPPDDDTDSEDDSEDSELENEEDMSPAESRMDDKLFKTPVIMPRRRFFGHCNIETVKDVNFIGPEDEFVVSGSDDGNFFLWEKETGRVHGIYEGDGSVVNVIESHPHLPLIACSGIDTTVKLFAPANAYRESKFSKLEQADEIISVNTARTTQALQEQYDVSQLFLQYRAAMRRVAEVRSESGSEDSENDRPCAVQ